MIECEKWQEPHTARFVFSPEDVQIIKSSISHMRSGINRLEQDFIKQNSFADGLKIDDLVRLHSLLGLYFVDTCNLLEIISASENELSNYLNKFL